MNDINIDTELDQLIFNTQFMKLIIEATFNTKTKCYFDSSTPRSSKQWGKLMKSAGSNFNASGSLENILFGSSGKCAGGNSSKIAHARYRITVRCGVKFVTCFEVDSRIY